MITTNSRTRSSGMWRPDSVAAFERRYLSWQQSLTTRDIALLVARLSLAWIFIYHGSQTLFGAFNGQGIHGQAQYFAHTAGLQPATLLAVLNGISEFFGGIAVGVGLLSRFSAFALVADMVIAMVTVSVANGIVGSSSGSGYELNLALAGLAFVIMLLGPGRIALDHGLRVALGRSS